MLSYSEQNFVLKMKGRLLKVKRKWWYSFPHKTTSSVKLSACENLE